MPNIIHAYASSLKKLGMLTNIYNPSTWKSKPAWVVVLSFKTTKQPKLCFLYEKPMCQLCSLTSNATLHLAVLRLRRKQCDKRRQGRLNNAV